MENGRDRKGYREGGGGEEVEKKTFTEYWRALGDTLVVVQNGKRGREGKRKIDR